MLSVERDALVESFFRLDQPQTATVVYLCLRDAGRRIDVGWLPFENLRKNLPDWIERVLPIAHGTLELTMLLSPEPVESHDHPVYASQERGLWGFSYRSSEDVQYLSPNEVINSNRHHAKAVHRLIGDDSKPLGQLSTYPSRQWLLLRRPHPVWVALQRQQGLPGKREVDRVGIAELCEGLAAWLYGQMDRHARLPYKYWPGNGCYSPADNAIRQWLATQALQLYAKSQGDDRQCTLARQRLQSSLADSYVKHDDCGLIVDKRGIKLGAIAVAGLALLDATEDIHRYKIRSLYRSVLAMRRPDGSFRTFWSPSGRDDNQNFYPGEALLFLVRIYRQVLAEDLRVMIDQSLDWYQVWHRRDPNPAFVPWHTQAYGLMYATTEDPKYLEPIVRMNDWLLPLQQWRSAPYPEMRGRFYEPRRPDFGPSHASSTAV